VTLVPDASDLNQKHTWFSSFYSRLAASRSPADSRDNIIVATTAGFRFVLLGRGIAIISTSIVNYARWYFRSMSSKQMGPTKFEPPMCSTPSKNRKLGSPFFHLLSPLPPPSCFPLVTLPG